MTASTFFGGPERQMLGLARSLPSGYRSVFLLFQEGGHYRPFAQEIQGRGFDARMLDHDTPRLLAATRELTDLLRQAGADVLCCNGYKANLLGRAAARRLGIPAVAVSRGWTGETPKVRLYEALDRWHLRWMDRVVCVSEGQAAKVRRTGVPPGRVTVIHNAVRPDRFDHPDPLGRERLRRLFREPPVHLVGAAGRLSPEKGFDVLVEAARHVVRLQPEVGFILFGEGAQRDTLCRAIATAGLCERFVLAGFTEELDPLLPCFDLLVLPSHTEGLPNVALEACAAGVPVVATAVGGTPEVIEDGFNGFLVPAGDAAALADGIRQALACEERRRAMGRRGRERVRQHFTFEAQARRYQQLFAELMETRPGVRAGMWRGTPSTRYSVPGTQYSVRPAPCRLPPAHQGGAQPK